MDFLCEIIITLSRGGGTEDTRASKARDRKIMRVQIPPSAPVMNLQVILGEKISWRFRSGKRKFFMETPIIFKSADQQIIGILHTPKSKRRVPLVILVHGWSGNLLGVWNAFFVKAARVFAKNGFAVLRFDFRGSGSSEGEFENQTISSMILDLKNVIDQIAKHEAINSNKIALIGHSQGGYISILHTAKDKRVKAVVLWMGRTADLKDFWSKTTFEDIRRKEYAIWYEYKVLNKTYVADSAKYNSESALRKIRIPIGMIYGELDTIVPPSEGLRVKKLAKGIKELKIFKDLDHEFVGEKVQKKVIDTTLGFLKKWLH